MKPGSTSNARPQGVLVGRVKVDAPYIRSTSWSVPPPYEPWIGNLFVNHSTSESERFRFFRLPESRVHLALFIGPGRAEFLVSGPTLRVHAVPFPAHEVIALELRSGGAQTLLGMPSSEVANQIVGADSIWGGWARELMERVALEPTTELRISRMLDLLRVRLTTSPDTATERIVALATSRRGCAPVRELADAAGYSERQLRRIFLDHVGVAPKDFGRIVRATAALRGLAAAPRSWSRYAMAHGYYDQAHFIAELREVVGQPPKRFLDSLVEPRLLTAHAAVQSLGEPHALASTAR